MGDISWGGGINSAGTEIVCKGISNFLSRSTRKDSTTKAKPALQMRDQGPACTPSTFLAPLSSFRPSNTRGTALPRLLSYAERQLGTSLLCCYTSRRKAPACADDAEAPCAAKPPNPTSRLQTRSRKAENNSALSGYRQPQGQREGLNLRWTCLSRRAAAQVGQSGGKINIGQKGQRPRRSDPPHGLHASLLRTVKDAGGRGTRRSRIQLWPSSRQGCRRHGGKAELDLAQPSSGTEGSVPACQRAPSTSQPPTPNTALLHEPGSLNRARLSQGEVQHICPLLA